MLVKHFKENKKVYEKAAIITLAFVIEGSLCFANIDTTGNKLYVKIRRIGRWIIAIKGSIDIIGTLLKGDPQGAKKAFFTYLGIYAILFAFPWALNEVETIFNDL